MAAAGRINLNDFPKLEIDHDNVSGSWNKWLTEFQLAVELVDLNLGTEEGANGPVAVFRGRKKTLVLLNSIGTEGRDLCQSLGINLNDAAVTYANVLDRLRAHYGIEDTVYVKNMKFVTVHQTACENENDYLVRVEKLSRNVNFGDNNDAVRQEFAVAIAVNGLRESALRTQLMQEANLTFDGLTNLLRTRRMAKESDSFIQGTKLKIEAEVGRVSKGSESKSLPSQGKSYHDSHSNDRCYFCYGKGHQIRFCSKVKCYECQELGHMSRDCLVRKRKRREKGGSRSSSDSSSNSDDNSPTKHVRFDESLKVKSKS